MASSHRKVLQLESYGAFPLFPSSLPKLLVFCSVLSLSGACTYISNSEHEERMTKLPQTPSFGVPSLSRSGWSTCADSESIDVRVSINGGDAELITSVTYRWDDQSEFQTTDFEISQGNAGRVMELQVSTPARTRDACPSGCELSLELAVTLSNNESATIPVSDTFIMRAPTDGPVIVDTAFMNFQGIPVDWTDVYVEAETSTRNYFGVRSGDYPALRVAVNDLELGYGRDLADVELQIAMCPIELGQYSADSCYGVSATTDQAFLSAAEAEFEVPTDDFGFESCGEQRYQQLWQWYLVVANDVCVGEAATRISDYAFRVVKDDCDSDGYEDDCEDDNPAVNPGAVDITDDGIDQIAMASIR